MSGFRWWVRWTKRAARDLSGRRGEARRAGLADALVRAAHRIDPRPRPVEARLVQNVHGPSSLFLNGELVFTGFAVENRR